MTMPLRFSLLLILALLLSACGLTATPAPVIPTKVPPTPFSTHLPAVETAIPAGFDENNPVQLLIVGDDESAADALEEALNTLTNAAVDVILVESQNEAMTALCSSASGRISGAWLNGQTYPAARQCGIVSLQSESDSASGVLVISAEFTEEGGLAAALAENFCRISVSDFYSWLLPQMLIAAEGIDPATIADVNEYPDNDALFAALNAGECAAIGMSELDWEAYQETLPTATPTAEGNEEEVEAEPQATVVASSAQFPLNIMVFPFGADLQVINEISNAILLLDSASGRSEFEAEVESTPDPEATAAPEIDFAASDLDALFGEGYFVPAGNFSELDAFLEATGFDFAEIGQ